MTGEKFVADGGERLRRSPEYQTRKRAVVAQVEAAFAPRLAVAGPLARVLLRVAMAREIRRGLREVAPPDALYLKA